MTDSQRMQDALRKLNDALQVVNALASEPGSLQFHLTLEELAKLLNSTKATLYRPEYQEVK